MSFSTAERASFMRGIDRSEAPSISMHTIENPHPDDIPPGEDTSMKKLERSNVGIGFQDYEEYIIRKSKQPMVLIEKPPPMPNKRGNE